MKKFILPIFILIFLTISLFFFKKTAFAFLGLNEGGGSSMDCYKVLESATRDSKEVIEWNADKEQFFKYTSQKVINKQDGSYCLLQRGQPKNDLFHDEQEVRITYFSSKDQALSQVNTLKGQERADFAVSSSDGQGYLGITQNKGAYLPGGPPPFYEIEGETYARSVRALGNCVAEVKFLDHTERHGYTVESRQAFFDLMKLFIVDPEQRLMDKYISVNSEILAFCGAKGQKTQSTPVQTPQTPAPTSSEQKPSQPEQKNDGKTPSSINDWIKNTLGELDIEHIGSGSQPERPPTITQKEQAAMEKTPPQKSYSVGIINTEGNNHGLIKYPASQEFTEIKMGDIPPGSTIVSHDDQIVIFNGIGAKGIIVVEPNSEFTIPQIGSLNLSKGTVEVKVEKALQHPAEQHDVSTEFIDLIVVGTHYWVTHEPGKQTLAGVYAGKIQVKTKDGKTTTVSPNGDKSGVVVVTQKLSVVKVASAGLALVLVLGATVFILKRKFFQKRISKKKRNQ